jgi:transcription elongation GreA/GreB family factor
VGDLACVIEPMERALLPQKTAVISALLEAARVALETAEHAQAIAQSEATSAESKSEGKYDTRATEASYLARGQAERVASMRTLLAWFKRLPPDMTSETVSLGALVELAGDRHDVLFIAPSGGERVEIDGVEVKTISLAAPLGRAMVGLEEGDEFEVRSPGGLVTYEVLHLA